MVGVDEWEVEVIPDPACLYMRIHQNSIQNGTIVPGAFKNRGNGMSVDWDKYSTPEESRRRARKPAENGIVRLVASDVRAVPNQEVIHSPDLERHNRAHSEVVGEKDEETRIKLRRISTIIIPFETPL